MNTTIFRNQGLLSLDAITTFGVSVKETDNPIGQFGTGLKYALAVLMREGCLVNIWIDGEKHGVGFRNKTIRGQQFEIVTLTTEVKLMDLNGDYDRHSVICELPFTTDLGKKWELWMAFRELYSNVMDENGICYGRESGEHVEACDSDETMITVASDAFYEILKTKSDLFIETEPVAETKHFELHDGEDVTGIYSKGIKIAEFEKPLLHRYNFTSPVTLTEDRTLKHQDDFTDRLKESVKESTDEDFIKRIVLAGKEYFESGLNFSYESDFGATFLKTVRGLIKKHKNNINPTILSAYESTVRKQRAPKTWSYTVKVIEMSGTNKESVGKMIEKDLAQWQAKVSNNWW